MTETTDPLEPILFCKISENEVNKSKVKDIVIIMQYLAIEHRWDVRTTDGYNKAKELLIKSVKYN